MPRSDLASSFVMLPHAEMAAIIAKRFGDSLFGVWTTKSLQGLDLTLDLY